MKKRFLLKTMLLLCALIAGSSSVWADVSTLTPTSSNIAPSDDHFTVTYANGGGSSTTWGGNNCVRLYAKNTITFESKNGETITQITFTGTVNANSKGTYPTSMSASVGSITPSTISATGGTDFSWTYATGATSVTLTIGGTAGNIDLSGGEYVITYTPGGSDPSISASNVNIAQDATNGSIAYTLNNATGNVSASITSGDWLTLGTITASAVPFTCSANTGAERTATVTLSFTGAPNKVVTVTQAAKTVTKPTFNLEGGSYMQGTNITISSAGNTIYYNLTTDGNAPATPTNASTEYTAPIVLGSGTTKITAIAYDTYGNASSTTTRTYTGIALASLPFSWTGTNSAGKAALGNVTGVAGYSLGTDFAASNAPYRLKFDNVGSYVTIYTDGKPENVYFTAKLFNAASTGSKIKVQGSADGITFTDIEEFTIKGAANATFEFATSNDFAATHRAVKLVMSSKDQNVAVGTICISCIPLNPAKTYTTLTSAYNLDFTSVSSDLKAFIATEIADSKVQMTQVNKVPAGTGLVLKATTPGSAVNVPVFDGTSPDDVSANKMVGSATATTAVAENGGYILKDGVFQPALAGTLAAGKAYLNIVVSAPILTLDFGDATDINVVKGEGFMVNGSDIYNLNGQRVAQPTKGLYIVNGRKVVIK